MYFYGFVNIFNNKENALIFKQYNRYDSYNLNKTLIKFKHTKQVHMNHYQFI